MSANVYANNRGLGVLQFQVTLKKLIILVLMTSFAFADSAKRVEQKVADQT